MDEIFGEPFDEEETILLLKQIGLYLEPQQEQTEEDLFLLPQTPCHPPQIDAESQIPIIEKRKCEEEDQSASGKRTKKEESSTNQSTFGQIDWNSYHVTTKGAKMKKLTIISPGNPEFYSKKKTKALWPINFQSCGEGKCFCGEKSRIEFYIPEDSKGKTARLTFTCQCLVITLNGEPNKLAKKWGYYNARKNSNEDKQAFMNNFISENYEPSNSISAKTLFGLNTVCAIIEKLQVPLL